MKQTNFQGFTLIELLVVISILGLLSALIVSNLVGVRERARDSQRKVELQEVKKALRMYYNDKNYDNKNVYPSDTEISWGNIFKSSTGFVYMKQLPLDPLSGRTYFYKVLEPDLQDFCLWAILENSSDADIANSRLRCPDCTESVTGCSPDSNCYIVCAD